MALYEQAARRNQPGDQQQQDGRTEQQEHNRAGIAYRLVAKGRRGAGEVRRLPRHPVGTCRRTTRRAGGILHKQARPLHIAHAHQYRHRRRPDGSSDAHQRRTDQASGRGRRSSAADSNAEPALHSQFERQGGVGRRPAAVTSGSRREVVPGGHRRHDRLDRLSPRNRESRNRLARCPART